MNTRSQSKVRKYESTKAQRSQWKQILKWFRFVNNKINSIHFNQATTHVKTGLGKVFFFFFSSLDMKQTEHIKTKQCVSHKEKWICIRLLKSTAYRERIRDYYLGTEKLIIKTGYWERRWVDLNLGSLQLLWPFFIMTKQYKRKSFSIWHFICY